MHYTSVYNNGMRDFLGMSHFVSQCLTLSHFVSQCLTLSHFVSFCLILSHKYYVIAVTCQTHID